MAYRQLRIPVWKEQKMRALWRESFAVTTEADRKFADAFPNPQRAGCPSLWLLCSAALNQLPDGHPILTSRGIV
jgi:hypothetical protein